MWPSFAAWANTAPQWRMSVLAMPFFMAAKVTSSELKDLPRCFLA